MSKSTIGLRRSGLAAIATTSLVMGAIFAGAGVANADANFEFTRVNGQTRYDVSANAAGLYGKADRVILASGESGKFGDALTANFLAGSLGAPVLLTQLDETPASVKKAIEDAGATKITIVGGELSVSKEQEAALAEDYTVNRIAGRTRYDVAADIIDEGTEKSDTAIVATGEKFADALAGGPVAYAAGMPLAITARDEMPAAVLQALKDAKITKAVVLGGDLSVSQEVRDQLREAGITLVEEFKGADRAQVATMVADYAIKNHGFTNTRVNAATGREFSEGADALSAGPVSGKEKRAILVTAGDPSVGTERAVGEHLINWLEANAKTLTGKDNHLFGGPLSITDAMKDRMETAAQQVTSNQTYSVTPGESASLERVPNPDTNAQDDRQYSVSGLDNSKTYTIGLFLQGEVTEGADGQIRFADANGNNIADRTAPTADITVVNGASQNPNTSVVRVSPVNGTISFTVDGDSANETVVPVVWLDTANNGDLDLTKPATANEDAKTPAEAFGVGGATTYHPAAAGSGLLTTDKTIQSVDKTANSITTADAIYTYDANDNYYISNDENGADVGEGERVTMAEFEAQVSKNDQLDGFTYYQSNSELPSRWVLEDLSPTAPTAPTASNITDTSVTLTVPEADVANAEKVTVYGAVDSAPATENGAGPDGIAGNADDTKDETTVTQKSTVYATATADADTKTAGFQINVTGLKADTYYDFAVSQTVDGEESALSDELENVHTRPGPVDKPTITDAVLTEDAVIEGIATTNDKWTLTFSEPVNFAAGSTFSLTDVDGDTILVDCDEAADAPASDNGVTAATCAYGSDAEAGDTVDNDELVITLAENAEDRNAAGDAGTAGGGIEYPLTITAVTGVTDKDGDNATVDVANSADKVVDKEA